MEYFGLCVTIQGVQPLISKFNDITNIKHPMDKCSIQKLIVLINYYIDMWNRRYHMIKKPTYLTFTRVIFKWNSV